MTLHLDEAQVFITCYNCQDIGYVPGPVRAYGNGRYRATTVEPCGCCEAGVKVLQGDWWTKATERARKRRDSRQRIENERLSGVFSELNQWAVFDPTEALGGADQTPRARPVSSEEAREYDDDSTGTSNGIPF